MDVTNYSIMTAKDIMSFPVKTLEDDVSIEEAFEIISRFGYGNFPVIKEGFLKGIITKEDVIKSMYHKLQNATVKDIMSKEIDSVSPSTPIDAVEKKLIANNIECLPVIEQNIVVGIITRPDLFYHKYKNLHGKINTNIIELTKVIPHEIRVLFKNIAELGEELGVQVYVVGGFVRDLLLNKESNDIDLVVVGSGVSLAKAYVLKYGAEIVIHRQFNTASLILKESLTIDIVSARREFYRHPGDLPIVEAGSIYDDLSRRDFSINSMAILLNKYQYGKLIDYFGGLEDLENHRIKVLHSLSFIEDPTRIFRAIRFESRLGFKMDCDTQDFAEYALKEGYLSKLSTERIIRELKLMLQEKKIKKILLRMQEVNILNFIYPGIDITNQIIDAVDKVKHEKVTIIKLCKHKERVEELNIILYILFIGQQYDVVLEILRKISISKKLKQSILELINFIRLYLHQFNMSMDSWTRYQYLMNLSIEQIIALLCCYQKDDFQNNIREYLCNHRYLKLEIKGEDLLTIGVPSNKQMKVYFDEAMKYKIENITANKNEILKYLKTKRFEGGEMY